MEQHDVGASGSNVRTTGGNGRRREETLADGEQPVVVLIPAFNEAPTIAAVLEEVLSLGLDLDVHVLDNGSTDETFAIAKRVLASRPRCFVHHLDRPGKGHAVRWAFAHVPARAFVLVDADYSYPLERLKDLIDAVVVRGAGMATGDRLSRGAYRAIHGRTARWLGNRVASGLFSAVTGSPVRDVLSGLRVIDGALARRASLKGSGFELESELSLEVWEAGAEIREVPITYRGRPTGEESKLVLSRDGAPILWTLAAGSIGRRARRLWGQRSPGRAR